MVIHIFGAAGSGTSTLGKAIASKYGYEFIDVDDYYWLDTPIPFTKSRDKIVRVQMLKDKINSVKDCVVSGAICVWGDELIPYLDVVIKLEVPTDIRVNRLKKREYQRFGSRIEEGGDMYNNHLRFIDWAKVYDSGDVDVRSNKLHNNWLKKVNCDKLIIDGTKSIENIILEIESNNLL